jgi:hypothetical protein
MGAGFFRENPEKPRFARLGCAAFRNAGASSSLAPVDDAVACLSMAGSTQASKDWNQACSDDPSRLEHTVNLMPSFGFESKQYGGLAAFQVDASEAEFSTPETADEFAQHVISTICHASVTPAIGRRAYERCMRALALGSTARIGFRHPGKADAIDLIWRERERLFRQYDSCSDKLAFLATLPWIGPVTKHSLARRLGLFAEQHRAVA